MRTKWETLHLRTRVLQAVADYLNFNGYGPSIADIIGIIDPSLSQSVVAGHLRVLRSQKLLDFDRVVARSTRPTDAGWELAGYQAPVPARKREKELV